MVIGELLKDILIGLMDLMGLMDLITNLEVMGQILNNQDMHNNKEDILHNMEDMITENYLNQLMNIH
jgi:uncharacterized protein (DUF2164 family)